MSPGCHFFPRSVFARYRFVSLLRDFYAQKAAISPLLREYYVIFRLCYVFITSAKNLLHFLLESAIIPHVNRGSPLSSPVRKRTGQGKMPPVGTGAERSLSRVTNELLNAQAGPLPGTLSAPNALKAARPPRERGA